MTDDTETPKTSDTVIASAQADTTPGALSNASMTDKPGDGGVLFDADGNPISPTPNPFAGLVPLKVEGEPEMWNNREAMPDPDSAVPYTYNGQQMWIEGPSDADGNPVAPSKDDPTAFVPSNTPSVNETQQMSATPAMALGTQVDPRVLDNEKFIQGSQWPVFSKADEPNPIGSDLRSDVEALKADLLYLRSLHGWPVEEGSKLKAYYHDGLKKLGIGE